MRIGLVWVPATPLTSITVRYERYAEGLRALGHEPITVSLPGAVEGYGDPTAVAPEPSVLRDPAFYRSLGLDAAIVVTWLGLPDVVSAMREACVRVVAIADSDGRVGASVHPADTLARGILQFSRLRDRVGAAKYWAQRFLQRGGRLDADFIASIEASSVVAVHSIGARRHVERFLGCHGRLELARKLAVIPYPVDDRYRLGDVPSERSRRVIAVGRWDDPQKDAPLMARTISGIVRADPTVGFDLVGGGGETVFRPLTTRFPTVTYHGRQSPDQVVNLMRRSRTLVVTSRWESGPIVLNEALCSGCSFVGPAVIPTIEQYAEGRRYGVAAAARSARALSMATLDEMRRWDRGERDAHRIASAWRPAFEPATVCRQLLAAMDAKPD